MAKWICHSEAKFEMGRLRPVWLGLAVGTRSRGWQKSRWLTLRQGPPPIFLVGEGVIGELTDGSYSVVGFVFGSGLLHCQCPFKVRLFFSQIRIYCIPTHAQPHGGFSWRFPIASGPRPAPLPLVHPRAFDLGSHARHVKQDHRLFVTSYLEDPISAAPKTAVHSQLVRCSCFLARHLLLTPLRESQSRRYDYTRFNLVRRSDEKLEKIP